MEENKNLTETEAQEETLQEVVSEEEPEVEEAEEEERRGLFGAKKRKRDEKTVLMFYTMAAVYLLYCAYSMIEETIRGEVTGNIRIVYIISSIAFVAAGAWVLYICWKARKRIRKEEEEKARKEAEENGEVYDENAPKGILGMLKAPAPEQGSSIASKASVYYNPADDDEDEEEDEDESDDDTKASEEGETEEMPLAKEKEL